MYSAYDKTELMIRLYRISHGRLACISASECCTQMRQSSECCTQMRQSRTCSVLMDNNESLMEVMRVKREDTTRILAFFCAITPLEKMAEEDADKAKGPNEKFE